MNRKISSDPNRKIRLEGVGEVSRPVDIDQSVTGFSQLVSLRIYKFLPEQIINGEAEEDEVCIVFLSGNVTMEVTGKENHAWTIQGRKDVFDGLPHVVYLPPHYHYKLSPHTDAEVAYARAKAEGRFAPRLIRPEDIKTETLGEGLREYKASYILQKGDAEKLLCTEYYLPREHEHSYEGATHEQLIYNCVYPANGRGQAKLSADSEMITLVHGDCLAITPSKPLTISTKDCTIYNLHLSVQSV
jgi:5-deoxy-D-glucuronate isomerase